MIRLSRPLLSALVLSLVSSGLIATAPASARTLDLAFMPPVVEPQELCTATGAPAKEDDLTIDTAANELTESLRLRYLIRDIRNLQQDDANRWFDFLITLIDWRAQLDTEFAGTEALLAKIRLYVDAGRLDALREAGLIEQLRQTAATLNNAQTMALAQYYLNGIGVAKDEEFARSLILDAAYGGNVDALLSLARMELQGNPVQGWDAPLDLTIQMAFGGMLGQMNEAVCNHAERIAKEYLNGDVVSRNPDIAYAWYKFAADLGGGQAAWRIVEFHLNADAAHKDNAEMLHYLKMAVQHGITLDDAQKEQIKSAGKIDEATLVGILGYNMSEDTGRNRPSITPYLQMSVNVDGEFASKESPYITYLHELTRFDTAPGWVFTTLANEVLTRKGRWAGEAEAMELLEEAARRQDPEGMQLLAQKLIRQRNDPVQINRAINLFNEVVTRFGVASAMNDLDGLYRCQIVDAPQLADANLWARNYRATQAKTVDVSAGDLISLDPFKKPEMLAQIQTQALMNQPESLANYMQRLQLNPWASDQALRMWARRGSQSDKALELFAELEYDLASNPTERDLAIELFRRVYLNNGVTTAADLAIALEEDNGRDPAIAKEIIDLLTKAGNRGEGQAIRFKARLLAKMDPPTPPEQVYEEYKDIIEERGDFLALMFALPYVGLDKVDDYIDRAVSMMTCGTKDADELGDAFAILQAPDMSYHWRQVGLSVYNGHVLAKLNLSDSQIDAFNTGAAPTEVAVYSRNVKEGDESAHRSLYALTSDPDLKSYDPAAAADHLQAILAQGSADDQDWVLSQFRNAPPELRDQVAARIEIADLYLKAAQRGDVTAKLDYALLMRQNAQNLGDLRASVRWLQEAADSGNVDAMAELGQVLAYGIGVPQDRRGALVWLEQAERAGNPQARELARLLRIEAVK